MLFYWTVSAKSLLFRADPNPAGDLESTGMENRGYRGQREREAKLEPLPEGCSQHSRKQTCWVKLAFRLLTVLFYLKPNSTGKPEQILPRGFVTVHLSYPSTISCSGSFFSVSSVNQMPPHFGKKSLQLRLWNALVPVTTWLSHAESRQLSFTVSLPPALPKKGSFNAQHESGCGNFLLPWAYHNCLD